jgi:hypothetical protein
MRVFDKLSLKFAQPHRAGYGYGMTVEAIKEAIVHLSGTERRQLAEWLDEFKEDEWDKQIEKDFSPGGRGVKIGEEIDRQIAAGNYGSLEEGLRLRRERRAKK